jgi:hypothetical protein
VATKPCSELAREQNYIHVNRRLVAAVKKSFCETSDFTNQDRAVWRSSPRVFTFEDRSGDRYGALLGQQLEFSDDASSCSYRTVYIIGSRRYVSRYPAPSPLHAWAQFAVELTQQRSLFTEATSAASGNSSQLDQAEGKQLTTFVALLKNVIKRQRQMHLSRIFSWERQNIENQQMRQFYDNFRCSRAFPIN